MKTKRAMLNDVDTLQSLVDELKNAIKNPDWYKDYWWMSSKERVYANTYECIEDILTMMENAIGDIYDANEERRKLNA